MRTPGKQEGSRSRSRTRSRSSDESGGRTPEENWTDEEGDVDRGSPREGGRGPLRIRNSDDGHMEMGRGRRKDQLGPHNDWGYKVPEDPWIIHARFRRTGMFPPGVLNPSSAHSSVVDLASVAATAADTVSSDNTVNTVIHVGAGGPTSTSNSSGQPSREGSITGLPSSEDIGATTRMLRDKYARPEESVYVYVTIQLYSIERDTFLVDFKASGYENLEHRFVKEMKVQGHGVYDAAVPAGQGQEQEVWKRLTPGEQPIEGEGLQLREAEEFIPQGRATMEKRATSPFPFLDVASGLIIQLAEGS